MIDCSEVFGFQAQIIVQAQFWFERWRDALPCKKYLEIKSRNKSGQTEEEEETKE